MIRFKKGDMQFEVGDVAVNETEFTTSYLNRRGLRFEYTGKSLVPEFILYEFPAKNRFRRLWHSRLPRPAFSAPWPG